MKKRFRSFQEAKMFVHSLGLKNRVEWKKFCQSDSFPNDIPRDPFKSYGRSWKNWKDWLGYEKRHQKNWMFKTFVDAKIFVNSLGLKNQKEWRNYCKSGRKPSDIPANPARSYPKKWKGYGDWLGTGTIHPKYLEFLPFDKAREFTRTLKLKNVKEWFAYCDSGKKPENIPRDASSYYKQEWISWSDWLSENSIPPRGKRMLSFEEARQFARSLNLKGKEDWNKFVRSGKKPHYIPADPSNIFKNKGWITWDDWLGTGKIDPRNVHFKSYEEAKKSVKTFGIKNQKEWAKFAKTKTKPIDIPANPAQYYENEWGDWGDWLGTGTISNITKSRNWLGWEEAKSLYQKIAREHNIKNQRDWSEYVKNHSIPENLPRYPSEIYSRTSIEKRDKKK